MSRHDQQLTVFIVLCALVTLLGFGASRWRRAKLDHLDEWGLAGRRFGTVITWFLLGGDLYTAYTFIAVPGAIFHKVAAVEGKKPYLTITRDQYAAYASLAFGSALALFLYPHALTGVFAAKGQAVIRRNAAFLPAYSFMLGLIALLGYMAIAADAKPLKASGANGAVPALLDKMFNAPFSGFAFAAIAIGALVPASVMSIAAANLFSRNIYREYLRPRATSAEEALVSKLASLVVKFGALAFILWAPATNVIYFQLA